MTIPRIPGLFDWLTQGVGAGFQAYDQQKLKQYEEAQAGARTIMNLIQQGQLKPEQLSDPATIRAFQAAKIPVPNAANIVPSVKALEAERIVGRLGAAPPGSTEESLILDLPTYGKIREADFMAEVQKVRDEVFAKYPAVARKIAGVFAPEAVADQELSARASADPEGYTSAAIRFVANAQGDAVKAKALAQADPQYQELVNSGQLSDEYFAEAARQYALLNENQRIKWAEAANRRAAIDASYRDFTAQDRSFDQQVQRLQRAIESNKLSQYEQITLGDLQARVAKGEQLDASEQRTLQKVRAVEEASAEIDRLFQEREDVRDRFGGKRAPVDPRAQITPPQAGGPAERRAKSGSSTTAPRSAPPRKASESDADYWERLKASGMSSAEATAQVNRTRK